MDAMLNVVLPVFGVIFAGYLARGSRLLGAASAEALNRFVYYIAVPPLLFLATARTPVAMILNGAFIAVYLLAAALTLALALAGGRLLFGHRDLATLTVHGFAAIFANTVYMGIPLFLAAFGEEGTAPILVAALVSNLLFMGVAIVLMEVAESAGHGYRRIIRDVTGALAVNPILIPLVAGLLASVVNLSVPGPLARFLELLAGAAGPTALFAMGLSLYGHPLAAGAMEVGWLVLLRLVVNPLMAWWLAGQVVDLEPFWANSAVLVSALPSGALVFVVAQRYGVYVQRAAAAVVASTLLSMATLSVLLGWFGAG